MKLNPIFVAISLFLLVGLIWSGGHVGWLIAMGIYLLVAVLVSAAQIEEQKRAAKQRRLY